jgi:3-oxoacyl-[acyl-carrier protein] reductase
MVRLILQLSQFRSATMTLHIMRNYMDLTGRIALITGASSGIGAAAATVMADLGARVAIGYHVNQAGAEQVRDTIVRAGGKAITIRADVRRSEDIRALVKSATDQLGPIDILVNNAGSLVQRMKIQELTEQRWDEIMDLNLKSAVLCSQAVTPSMIERKRGAIVNVASIAARHGGGPGAGAYATAKGGVITFTKALAKELAPQGVRVNAVSPGVIDTPFHEAFSTPELLRHFVTAIPLGRLGTAMECATVIAFLASDAASFIVGESVEVNGGQLML